MFSNAINSVSRPLKEDQMVKKLRNEAAGGLIAAALFFSGCVTDPDVSPPLSVYSDAVIREYNGAVYILERTGADNIIRIDARSSEEELFIVESDFQSGLVERYQLQSEKFIPVKKEQITYQYHFGVNWNPQDIAFLSSTRAYIAHADHAEITVFNPDNGTVIDHIDIAPYTFMPDSNSSPYASDLELVGKDLYVLLQRRNGWNPGAPSLILKIDTSNDEITDTIACVFKNGFGMTHDNGVLYVSNPGDPYTNDDGAIEAIDLSTNDVRTVIEETELGGNPNQVVHKNGSRFYVQNYIGWQMVSVVEIDGTDGSITATLDGVTDAYGGLYFDGKNNRLFVGERSSENCGILVFKDNVLTGSVIKSGSSLPPTGCVLIN